ncbi:hypothetical protein GCM10010172_76770 [Paractinoplanes ferrugineus]|uniref:Uncharacterized protein n=1 Tax=Paractinoplanes ferrugineus TaxID=113564 RepID=A0A919J8D7_9ACTN|nr:hypothetical protein Afe05nite_82750 [Actinoplanes ferrugineus]
MDGDVVPGPAGGLERLTSFVTRFGGMTFCPERPGCYGTHRHPYEFDSSVSSGWDELEDGDHVAVVGSKEGYPLTLSWSTGRLGVVEPDYWIADSAINLIESCALGQSVYTDEAWSEAVELGGKGAGWGLAVDSNAFRSAVGEAVEASCEWNRWYLGEHVAVHGWRVTYEAKRSEAVMAWYRDEEGRRLIEAVAGPLRPAEQTRKTPR